MNIFEKRKPHVIFRRIIQYCKLMHYDIDEILNMSDNELRIWYNRMLKMSNDQFGYRIKSGIDIDNNGQRHVVTAITQTRFHKKGADE